MNVIEKYQTVLVFAAILAGLALGQYRGVAPVPTRSFCRF